MESVSILQEIYLHMSRVISIIDEMTNMYQKSIVGGTFDHFHIGHQKLLDVAFESSERVIIGITTAELLKNKYLPHVIEDLRTRRESLISYLKEKSYFDRAVIIEIQDVYGNSLKEKDLDAIFVTDDTLANAEKINFKRVEKGFKPLEIVNVPFLFGSDGEMVSSERIRRGEIDREGNVYFELFTARKKYILPEDLRSQLRKPIGKVVRNVEIIQKMRSSANMLISIGDAVTISFLNSQIQPDICIFDYMTQREVIELEDREVLSKLSNHIEQIENEAGVIERRAAGTVRRVIQEFLSDTSPMSIHVKGEEDLMVIPAILLSPLGTLVVYGQRDLGIVVVKVTEKKKYEVKKIFSRFS